MIDPDGYRPNVGIILARCDRRVFWARRVRDEGWQFPQGGMRSDETPREAMFRELEEETGLCADHVEIIGETPGWLKYRLPRRYLRRRSKARCIGQKQVWFLLRFLGEDSLIRFDHAGTEHAEFDRFCWVDFWYPADNVIAFKREVYKRALRRFEPLLDTVEPARQDYTLRRSG